MRPNRLIGRYVLHDEIAAGGMATVHFGRLLGPVGFARTVAIKRLHPTFAKDPEFVAMFLDEARIAARVRHPNVVSTLDIVALEGELFLVMEYAQGESLARLNRVLREKNASAPPKIATAILSGVLQGLHAAHEAVAEDGSPLGIVHRDVSPQNVLVGADGVARVVDFGVAKAVGRLQATREGQVKGKVAYMAPEQLVGRDVDRRADIYAASVILWETLTGQRLFVGDSPMEIMTHVLEKEVPPPSSLAAVPTVLDAVVLRGLASSPDARFSTAREMAIALETAISPATTREVGDWVDSIAGSQLKERALRVTEIEKSSSVPHATSLPASLRSGSGGETRAEPATDGLTSTNVGMETRSEPLSTTRKPWRSRALLLLATLVLLGGIGILALRTPRGATVTPAAIPPVAALPATTAADNLVQPAASISAPVPSAGASASESARVPRAPSRAKRPSAPGPVARSCDPPYTLDPTGLHVAKPECF